MSQYSRPLAVLMGAPVTLVGPLVLVAAVWAPIRPASANSVMATTTVFIIPLFLRQQSWRQSSSSQRNHVNFNQNILRKPGDFDGGARRGRLLEVAAVDFVHGGEICHVLEEDGAAQNLLQAAARGLQNGGEVLEHAVGLRAYIAGDDLRGGGIDRDLSGSKDQPRGSNGLRVRPNGLRSLLGGDHFAHDSSSANCVPAETNDEEGLKQITIVKVKQLVERRASSPVQPSEARQRRRPKQPAPF